MGNHVRTAMLMMMRLIHLLLIAAAIDIQAATDEAYLDSMIDDSSHDVGASAGRRGGSLTTSGSFMMGMTANRAGNDEEEFGEADEDPSTPQTAPEHWLTAVTDETKYFMKHLHGVRCV